VAKPKLINAKIYGTTPDPAKERRNQLWSALNRYVRESGGAVVSAPGISPLRVEVAKNSSLPKTLTDAGYSVSLGERVTRVVGDSRNPFEQMDVLWIDLPRIF
jgi:hypothetical protein